MHNTITLRNKTKNALTEEEQKYLREKILQFIDLSDLIAYNEIWCLTYSKNGLLFKFKEYDFDSNQIRLIRNELAFQYRLAHPDWNFCKISSLEITSEAKSAVSDLQKALDGDEIATAIAVEHCIAYFNSHLEQLSLLSKVNFLLNHGNAKKLIAGGLNALGFYREACDFFLPAVREIGAVFHFIVKEKIANYDYFTDTIAGPDIEDDFSSNTDYSSSKTTSNNSKQLNQMTIIPEAFLDLYEVYDSYLKASISPILLI